MVKMILEREKCIGCSTCSALCDKFFELSEDGKSHIKGGKLVGENEEVEIEDAGCAKDAAEACPAQCIHIK